MKKDILCLTEFEKYHPMYEFGIRPDAYITSQIRHTLSVEFTNPIRRLLTAKFAVNMQRMPSAKLSSTSLPMGTGVSWFRCIYKRTD